MLDIFFDRHVENDATSHATSSWLCNIKIRANANIFLPQDRRIVHDAFMGNWVSVWFQTREARCIRIYIHACMHAYIHI
jgi:hypothetical protein